MDSRNGQISWIRGNFFDHSRRTVDHNTSFKYLSSKSYEILAITVEYSSNEYVSNFYCLESENDER